MSDLEKKSIEMSEEINDTNEIIEEKPKFKLNPEIKGMIGLFVIIFILGLIIAISLGKFEQWFGVDPFTGAKITNKIVYIEEGEINKVKAYDINTGKTSELFKEKDIKDIAVSANGKKIAYVGYDGNDSQIYLCNADGKKKKVITNIEGAKSKPKFSPDGKYISYIANGRVFRADLNGSNAFSVIPTREQQQVALYGREGKLVVKDYVWANNGEGMLGVVSINENDERLVLMSDANGDAHEIPFPEGANFKFVSVSAAYDYKSYVAVGVMNNNYVLFIVEEPEEHNHKNIETMEDMGVLPVPMGPNEITSAALYQEGLCVLYSVKSKDKKMPSGVYTLDFQNKKITQEFPFTMDKFQFLYEDKILIYNSNNKVLSYIDREAEKPEIFAENVQSFNVSPKNENNK